MDILFAQAPQAPDINKIVEQIMWGGGVVGIINQLIYLVGLVFYILIVVKMFQNGQTGVGIASIIGICCCYGPFLVIIYGWMKASEWKMKPIVLSYTILFVVNVILAVYVAIVVMAIIAKLPK